MRAAWVLFLVAALPAACGGEGGSGGDLGRAPLTIDAPATVTGVLDVSVEEGPVGDDDISEVNFGSVELDDGFVLVEIPASVVRDAGLSRDELVGGGTFEVTLSGEGQFFDPRAPTYVVTGLAPLD